MSQPLLLGSLLARSSSPIDFMTDGAATTATAEAIGRATFPLRPASHLPFPSLSGRVSPSATDAASLSGAAAAANSDQKLLAAIDALLALYRQESPSTQAIANAERNYYQLLASHTNFSQDIEGKRRELMNAEEAYEAKQDKSCFDAFIEVVAPIVELPIIGVIPSAVGLLVSLAVLVKEAVMAAFRSLELLWTSDEDKVQGLLDHNVKELKKCAGLSLLFALQILSLGFFSCAVLD